MSKPNLYRSMASLITAVVILAGCAAAEEPASNAISNGANEPAGEAEAQSAPEAADESISEQADPDAAEAATSESGDMPHVVFLTAREDTPASTLWIAAADGSSVEPLAEGEIVGGLDVKKMVAPDGRHAAYITQQGEEWRNLTLHIISLPGGASVADIALTSDITEPPQGVELYEWEYFEALRSIAEYNGLAWSPDGSQLAFLGAQGGPSSDLFVFDTGSGETLQLTDGPTQGLKPAWSPDGSLIWHLGITSLGTGAGLALDRVWAAVPDGSAVYEVMSADEVSRIGDEVLVGWADDDVAIMYNWDAGCGPRDLRLVEIPSGDTTLIREGAFHEASYVFDADVLAVSVAPFGDFGCNEGEEPGIYLYDTAGSTPVSIGTTGYQVIYHEAAGRFTALKDDGFGISFDLEGNWVDLEGPTYPAFDASPDGDLLAWAVFSSFGDNSEPGAWIGAWDAGAATQVTDVGAVLASFAPDASSLLVWTSDGDLLFAPGPDYLPPETMGSVGVLPGADSVAWISR